MALSPKTNEPRPPLPERDANPYLSTLRDKKLEVKYQVVTREGQEIVVGRVKIPTPGDHRAFILRRFDTGAISLTTMFRAAFPTALEDAEKAEANWVKANFDSQGANGSAANLKLRLAGTWVTTEVALTLAESYNLEHVLRPLAEANPDPEQEYRRSTKPASPRDTTASAHPAKGTVNEPIVLPPTPTPMANNGPGPTKRRKGGKEPSPALQPPPQAETLVVPRRSTRASSPASVASSNSRGAARGRKKPVSGRQTDVPPTVFSTDDDKQSDTKVETDPDYVLVPGPDMHTDVEEQRALISQLKSERELAKSASGSSEGASKRTREGEEEPPKFNFKEGTSTALAEDTEMSVIRRVATNRRVQLAPQQKSAAWGVFLFAAGLAAAATIPSLLMG